MSDSYEHFRDDAQSSTSSSSNSMRNINWRALAGNAATRAKDYVATKEYKNTYDKISSRVSDKINERMVQREAKEASSTRGESECATTNAWTDWARQKMQRKASEDGAKLGVEKVTLFPGWAVRRYIDREKTQDSSPFDIDIFVSGYATSMRPPELATRSQRVFMQLAKKYAALPKLPTEAAETTNHTPNPDQWHDKLSKSTEDLLKFHPLPATPAEMTEEKETAALEAQFQRAEAEIGEEEHPGMAPPDYRPPSPTASLLSLPRATSSKLSRDDLRKLHMNLDKRLEPFWSSSLPNRRVRISVFATEQTALGSKHGEGQLIDFGDDEPSSPTEQKPLIVEAVQTTPTGDFQKGLRIPWDALCTHPKAVYVAFGEQRPSTEYKLYLKAELIPSPQHTVADHTDPSIGSDERLITRPIHDIAAVKLTHAGLRVISDIDDTVKVSDILAGAKTVFHNVFVSELSRLVIREMSEWYQRMWNRGVRFHYVSNSPFELLPVINEFIHLSDLPEGSVTLRSYTGRSLFNGLLSSPSVRKRTNVLQVLNQFSDSNFVLIGDSGEQDLELYASLAKERPQQIQAIFIRDVSTLGEPLTDPTGERWQKGLRDDVLNLFSNPHARANSIRRDLPARYPAYNPRKSSSMGSNMGLDLPGRRNTAPDNDHSNPRSSVASLISQFDSSATVTEEPEQDPVPPKRSRTEMPSRGPPGGNSEVQPEPQLQGLPLPTRRRVELQMRLNRARDEIPSYVKLRVFKDPLECTEIEEVLERQRL